MTWEWVGVELNTLLESTQRLAERMSDALSSSYDSEDDEMVELVSEVTDFLDETAHNLRFYLSYWDR